MNRTIVHCDSVNLSKVTLSIFCPAPPLCEAVANPIWGERRDMHNHALLEFHELEIRDQAKVLARLLEKMGAVNLRSIHELAVHEDLTVQDIWKRACQDVDVSMCAVPLRLLMWRAIGEFMEKLEITRNGQTDQFSVVLSRGNDTIRCMVTVDSGHLPTIEPDKEMRRRALSKAKALAKALDAVIQID